MGSIIFGTLQGAASPDFALKTAVFGGPNALALASDDSSDLDAALIDPASLSSLPVAASNDSAGGFVIVDSASLLNQTVPLSNALPGRDSLLIYRVQKGDTLSKIAASFGISLNTIFWANKEVKRNYLSPGQEIIILPVSGVIHEAVEGENLDIIAGLYGISAEKILAVNAKAAAGISVGVKLVIPDGKPKRRSSDLLSENLPDLRGYFALPTTGWNWGQLHPYNAVDIANACGTSIYASAEGLVSEVGSPASWNGGLGGYVLIEHPNRTATRYLHMGKNLVSVGDYVAQGDKIAEMGNTGNVKGSSGCHLHFEVRGAKNPLAK